MPILEGLDGLVTGLRTAPYKQPRKVLLYMCALYGDDTDPCRCAMKVVLGIAMQCFVGLSGIHLSAGLCNFGCTRQKRTSVGLYINANSST